MFILLLGNSGSKVWVEANEFSISYYSFNDDYQSLNIDGRHFREKAALFRKCVTTLSEKDIKEAFAIIRFKDGFTEEICKSLGL